MCGITRTDAAGGPREFTGIVDLTRGEDDPTACLSGPSPRKVLHGIQELAGRALRGLPEGGVANRDAGSLPGKARTPLRWLHSR